MLVLRIRAYTKELWNKKRSIAVHNSKMKLNESQWGVVKFLCVTMRASQQIFDFIHQICKRVDFAKRDLIMM